MLSLKGVSVHIQAKINKSFSSNLLVGLPKSIGGTIEPQARGYGTVKALRSIDLEIKKGDRLALIGHNGSGKSTLLRLISGIYTPTKGVISGQLFEPLLSRSFLVSEELSGIEAIKAHYLLNGQKRGISQQRCVELVAIQSGLGDYLRLPIRTYSKGMAERLMFCLTTIFSHSALAIDEGFGTADAAFQSYAERAMDEYLDKTDSIVLASHSNGMLRSFCNKGVVLDSGRIVYYGTLEDSLSYYDEETRK